MKRLLLLLSLTSIGRGYGDSPVGDTIPVGTFSSGDLTGWESRQFERETVYSLSALGGTKVLKAYSDHSASGLFKKVKVNLQEFPYINWRWLIEEKLPSQDETRKEGDDYVARIYVMRSGGVFFWNTKVLNYVWSSRAGEEDTWPNAFAPENNRMIAVRSERDQAGQWYIEKQNVYQAFKHWLGEDVKYIDAIAIMTDTDNTGTQATAYYGDIYFSRE